MTARGAIAGPAGRPAGGRLAYGYWLVLENPVQAAQVRLDLLPLAGHGLGLSEIQVFSAVTVSHWPDREIDLVGDPTGVGPHEPAATFRPRNLVVGPNPANPGTYVHYALPGEARVVLRMVDVRGHVVRTLVDAWRPAGAHRAYWDGRDNAGRAVASGVYMAVGEWGGVRSVGRVTLVR